MPGPSFAPIFAGVGLFLVMLGLVFGGLTLVLGIIALVLTLLYWLRRGPAPVRPRHRPDGPGAPGRDPRGATTGRPHARTVVAPVLRRVRGLRAVPRPGVRWMAAGGRGHRPDHDADRLADRRRPRLPTSRRGGDDRPHRQRPAPGDAAADVHGPGRPDRRRGRPAVGCVHDRSAVGRRWADRVRLAGCAASGFGSAGVRSCRVRASRVRRARRRRDGRRDRPRPGHRLRRHDVHGTGRQAVHPRVRQRGPGDAAQRRAEGRVGQGRVQGRDLQRRRDPRLRGSRRCRPGPTRTSAASTRT